MAYRNLIDWEKYLAEEQEIEALTDPVEAAERVKLLEEINAKVLDYNAHINAYDYAQHCKSIEARGLIFKPISKRSATRKWDAFFASQISPEEKRKIYYSNFKWHMFSYEKTVASKGNDAKRAFDRCKKESAYLFIQCTDEAWRIENTQLLTSADLDVDYSFERADVYIFDVKGKWAYARTHESDCGPYFLRIGKKYVLRKPEATNSFRFIHFGVCNTLAHPKNQNFSIDWCGFCVRLFSVRCLDTVPTIPYNLSSYLTQEVCT